MASFGLLLDNASVIIGSMLIAPLLWPILSLGLGVVLADTKLILRSIFIIIKAIDLGIIASASITVLFASPDLILTSGIINRTEPSLVYAIIAFIAGLAAAYSVVTHDINETLPGVAISVALIPPVASVGIGLALLNWQVMSQSFILFLTNSIGIIFASIIIFSLSQFYLRKDVAEQAMAKEDEKLNNEE